MGGAVDLWDDVLGVGAGAAGWFIDKATGLLVPQPVQSDSGKKPNNANAPIADPTDQPGSFDTPQDQCTASSDSEPNDESGQVSRHARVACCTLQENADSYCFDC